MTRLTGPMGPAVQNRTTNSGRARRQRRLSGREGRSRFCGELVCAVLRTYAETAGCCQSEGSGGGGNGMQGAVRREALREALRIAAERTARKGMRLMLLERTATEPWRRRRGGIAGRPDVPPVRYGAGRKRQRPYQL
jgi:hypothetical protein